MRANHSRAEFATEVPRWRVAADCPLCGEPLRVRENRTDRSRFYGCSGYPSCRFAEPIDDALAALAERIDELEIAVERASRATLAPGVVAKDLRELIALSHPDRWPNNPLAHEICARLTDLRARLAA